MMGYRTLATAWLTRACKSRRSRAALSIVFAMLAAPVVAQGPAVADRTALAGEKAALFERLRRDPSDPALTLAYAGVAARLDDNEAAAGALERLLMQNPALPGAALELGVLYFRMGSFKAARAYLARAKALGASPEMNRKIARYDEIAQLDRPRPPAAAAATPPVVPVSMPLPGAPQPNRVGTAAAVNQNATAAPVGAVGRRLTVRDAVFTGERIRTDAQGQVQLLLEDASTVAIGPHSDLAVDDFALDPKNSGGGTLRLDVQRGRLLLIGGTLSKRPNGVTVHTPSATLAVRGAIVLIEIRQNGGTWAVLLYGNSLTVTGSNGVSQTIAEPGFAISVAGPGGSPSLPVAVSVTELAALLAGLEGRPGGNGGAATPLTEAMLTRSGIAQIISGNLIESVRQAMHATLDEAAIVAFGLTPMTPGLFGLARGQGTGLTTNRCVTVSPSQPCR